VSGIVGIGGGIFLSPVLLLIKAGKTRHIATMASLFILSSMNTQIRLIFIIKNTSILIN
jgi:uncharacterized membrane protein YfcA